MIDDERKFKNKYLLVFIKAGEGMF